MPDATSLTRTDAQNQATTQPMTGSEVVLQALVEQGVEVIFGYPGGAVLPIYDAIFKQDKIRHILVRHEQGAVHAAEGYARSTGKVGVVLVTSGPGRHQHRDRPHRRAHGLRPDRRASPARCRPT